MAGTVQARIAQSLKVSRATVSRALRDHPGISGETRARVMKLAREMGYSSSAAKATAGRIGTFAVALVHAPRRQMAADYQLGFGQAAVELDMTLVLHMVTGEAASVVQDPDSLPSIMRRGLARGLVLVFRWPTDVVAQLCHRYCCVSVQHEYPGLPVDVVTVDHAGATDRLVQHLHGLGHRRIGFVGWSPELTPSRARFSGYMRGLQRLGLDYSPRQVINMATCDMEGFTRDGDPWGQCVQRMLPLIQDEGITAWIGVSDSLNDIVAQRLRQFGLRVPEDVSIAGYYLGDPDPAQLGPDYVALGAAAVRRLKWRLANPGDPTTTLQYEYALRTDRGLAPPPAPRGPAAGADPLDREEFTAPPPGEAAVRSSNDVVQVAPSSSTPTSSPELAGGQP